MGTTAELCQPVLAAGPHHSWPASSTGQACRGVPSSGAGHMLQCMLPDGTQGAQRQKVTLSVLEATQRHPCCLQAGALTDDDLHTALIQPLQPSVRLHVIIDACQSTPSLNLEYSAGLRRDGWSEWQVCTPTVGRHPVRAGSSWLVASSASWRCNCQTGHSPPPWEMAFSPSALQSVQPQLCPAGT